MEEKELQILKEIGFQRSVSKRLLERTGVVLKYDLCKNKNKVSRQLNCSIKLVNTWLKRWSINLSHRNKLYKIWKINLLTEKEYKAELILILTDKPRSGSPCKFTENDRNKIIALASESPEKIGLPFTHWSLELLRSELINRKIVFSISTSHLARLLKNMQVTTA